MMGDVVEAVVGDGVDGLLARSVMSSKGLERGLMGFELLLDADYQRARNAASDADFQSC